MNNQENYDIWFKGGKTQWTSDDGMWAIKSFEGYVVTGVVHFCDPNHPSGSFASELAEMPYCKGCNTPVPDEVQGLWFLQNLDFIPYMDRPV